MHCFATHCFRISYLLFFNINYMEIFSKYILSVQTVAFNAFFFLRFMYLLKGRVTGRRRSSICLFAPQMLTTAGAVPGRSQEPGTPSRPRKHLRYHLLLSQVRQQRGGWQAEQPGLKNQPSMTECWHSMQWLNALGCNTNPCLLL